MYRITPTPEWWTRLETFSERTTFHTPEWLSFIAASHDATPVLADVYDGTSRVGSFMSLVFRRFGIKILGSPFPGWTTMYMGFNLLPEVPRWMAFEALGEFAFRELGCLHFEVADRLATAEDGYRAGLEPRFYHSYETDLTRPEHEIFDGMDSACRRCVRKAEKSGLVIETAQPDDDFAAEYYDQLLDVFRKQGLTPTYSLETVQKFVHYLGPTGSLALFRARAPDGRSIATGIYHGMNHFAQFWGNASYRSDQHLRPNQALHWHALRYWKCHGVRIFDWGGEGEYKEKYGCRKVTVMRFCKSRVALLSVLRDQAQKAFLGQMRIRGWWQSLGKSAS